MPPKAKFTRDEITKAALELVRREGFKALTARGLGASLGSSPRPIFTVFQNIEEVQREVRLAAAALYNEYVCKGLSQAVHPFKGVGEQYIRFAVYEPKLFQLLFMKEQAQIPGVEGVLSLIDENYPKILQSIEQEYGVSRKKAEKLYRHLWIYTHGIASLCATGMCRFTEAEIGTMLTEVFTGLLLGQKGGEKND